MSATYGPLTVYSPNGQYSSQGTNPTWSTQFSQDNADTNAVGSGVHSYAGFNTFLVTVQSGVVTGFSVVVYSGGEGIATPYSQSFSGGSCSVTVNGSTYFSNTSSPLGSTLVSYTAPADGPNPVKVTIAGTITVSGRDGGAINRTASSSFSVTYELYAQTANLIFSSYTSGTTAKMVFLEPISSLNNGKLIAIKDKTFQSAIMNTWIYAPQTINIEGVTLAFGYPPALLNVNGQCNTYIIDNANSIYRIANIYPSHNQLALPTINPSTLTPVSASSSIVDIFSVDSPPGRTTVNNLVELPAVSNPTGIGSLKIIIYGGRTSAKYTGNLLIIQEPSGGNLIDNTYGATTKLYLQTDASANANEKNTAIVFISNENQWFVLGYYETSPWTWSTATPGPQTYTIPSNTFQYNNIVSASPYVIALPGTQSLSLVKNTNAASTSEFFRVQTSGTSVFNEAGTLVNYTGNPVNSTTWLLAYSTGGGNFKNYVVVSYTPN